MEMVKNWIDQRHEFLDRLKPETPEDLIIAYNWSYSTYDNAPFPLCIFGEVGISKMSLYGVSEEVYQRSIKLFPEAEHVCSECQP